MSNPDFLYTEDEFRGLTDEILESLNDPDFQKEAIPTKEEPQLPDFKGLTPATSKDVHDLFGHVIDIKVSEQEAQILIQGYTSLILDDWLKRFRLPVKTKAGILGHIIHIIQVRNIKTSYQQRLKKMFELTQDMVKMKDITQALLEVLHYHAFKLLVWTSSLEQIFLPAEEDDPRLHQIAIIKEFQKRSSVHLLAFDYPRVFADNKSPKASSSVRQMLYGIFNPAIHSHMTTDQGLNVIRLLSAAAKNLLEASPGPSPNPEMVAHLKQVVQTRVDAFPFEEDEDGSVYVPDFITMAKDMIRHVRNFIVNEKFEITLKQAETLGFIFDQMERIPEGWNPLSFNMKKPKPGSDESDMKVDSTRVSPGLSHKATFEEIFRLERKSLKKCIDCNLCKAKLEKDTEVMALPCKHSFHPLCLALKLKDHGVCPDCKIPITPRLKFTTGYDDRQLLEKHAEEGMDTMSLDDHYLMNADEDEMLASLPPPKDQAPFATALKCPFAAKHYISPHGSIGVVRPELDFTQLSVYSIDSLASQPMHLPPAVRLVDSDGNITDVPNPSYPKMLKRLDKIPGIDNLPGPSKELLNIGLQLERTRRHLGLAFIHCDDFFRNSLPDLLLLRKYERIARDYDSDGEVVEVVEKPSAEKQKETSNKRTVAEATKDAPRAASEEPSAKKQKETGNKRTVAEATEDAPPAALEEPSAKKQKAEAISQTEKPQKSKDAEDTKKKSKKELKKDRKKAAKTGSKKAAKKASKKEREKGSKKSRKSKKSSQ